VPTNEGERYRFYRKLLKACARRTLGGGVSPPKLSRVSSAMLSTRLYDDELKYLKCYAAAVGNDI